MTVIIDANLIVVLFGADARSEQVVTQFETWFEQDTTLHAPQLALYEVANALTRLIVAGSFDPAELTTTWEQIQNLPITYHSLDSLPRTIEIARTLSRQNAYDAAYLALAESLQAELWTLDTPLYRNAIGQGLPIRLIGNP
jgi:predicted nucleic acid-binding protein